MFLTKVELENYGPGCSATCKTTVAECPDTTINVKVNYKNERGVTAAVPNANVRFFLDGRAVGGGVADAGGNVRREHLAPGKYRIVASADKFDVSESTIGLDRCKSGDVALSLNPDKCVRSSVLVRRPSPPRPVRPAVLTSRTSHRRPRRPRYMRVWKCLPSQTWSSTSSAARQ